MITSFQVLPLYGGARNEGMHVVTHVGECVDVETRDCANGRASGTCTRTRSSESSERRIAATVEIRDEADEVFSQRAANRVGSIQEQYIF